MFFKSFFNRKFSFSNINFLIYIICNFIDVCQTKLAPFYYYIIMLLVKIVSPRKGKHMIPGEIPDSNRYKQNHNLSCYLYTNYAKWRAPKDSNSDQPGWSRICYHYTRNPFIKTPDNLHLSLLWSKK